MKNIEINISNKIATLKKKFVGVCGNSDYVIVFDFDDEWKPYTTKTARFKYNGKYEDVVFTGNECPMPVILDASSVEIGVYAGNLRTTTPACVLMKTCVLSGGGLPSDPTPDVYNQIIDKINDGMLKGEDGVSPSVEVSKSGDTTTIAITDASGVHTAEIKDGSKGDKGDKGDPGSDASVTAENIQSALGYAPVKDVLVAGTSVMTDGVANVPIASGTRPGVVSILTPPDSGLWNDNGSLKVSFATDAEISTRVGFRKAIVCANLDYAVKAAMCDGKGAAWTDAEQKAARERMGAVSSDDIPTIDATLSQEGQAADAKAAGNAIAQKAQIDDTAVDGDAWSSKHIIDTLCPPIEMTGNPVVCHPIAGYPLDVKVSLEPVQEGSGDPSPENVRPITGTDSVVVTRIGKNLIDTSSLEQNIGGGVTITPNNDGSLTVNGTATQTYVYMLSEYKKNLLINGITYTLSGTPSGADGLSLQVWNKEWLGDYVSDNGNGGTFTPSKQDIVPHGIAIRIQGGKSYDNAVLKPQLEIGSSRTDFEPYIGDTYTAELPETIYGGKMDWETGVLTVTHGQIASYAGETLPGEWISDRDVYAPDATPTTGAQVAYKLAEPYTVQLIPQQITALSGVNTLYTDSGDISVSGRTDMIWLTQSLIDRIAALETAAVSE